MAALEPETVPLSGTVLFPFFILSSHYTSHRYSMGQGVHGAWCFFSLSWHDGRDIVGGILAFSHKLSQTHTYPYQHDTFYSPARYLGTNYYLHRRRGCHRVKD